MFLEGKKGSIVIIIIINISRYYTGDRYWEALAFLTVGFV